MARMEEPREGFAGRSRSRRVVIVLGLVALGYGAVAYLALPEVWSHYEHRPSMESEPRVTRTPDDIPGDPLNVALFGTEPEIIEAFTKAGFTPAKALGLRSDLHIGASVLLDRPDPNAPVSNLFLWGRKQDLAFEQEFGKSADQRHHVRFWRSTQQSDDGRPLWLGSATFDRGSGVSHRTGQITHHISADIDAERDYLFAALTQAGQLVSGYPVTGIGPTFDGRNGGGDRYYTDGEMDVGVLSPGNAVQSHPPTELPSPPSTQVKAAPDLDRCCEPRGRDPPGHTRVAACYGGAPPVWPHR
jgi:hypothetical protein